MFNYDSFLNSNYILNHNNYNQRIFNIPIYYIIYSTFSNLFSDFGGAIFITNTTNKLYCIYSTFKYCYSNYDGGAIYYYSILNGGFVLNKICGYSCFSNSNDNLNAGQFSYSNCPLNKLNHFNYNSILYCANSTNLKFYSTTLKNGNISIYSTNSSNNIVTRMSSFFIYETSNFNFLFVNIINNFASGDFCLWPGIFNNKIQYSNFINNSVGNYGIIHAPIMIISNIELYYLIFLSNKNQLFSIAGGSILINNCWFEKNEILSGVTILSTFSLTNTFLISHYSTYLCYADFPIFNEFSNIYHQKYLIFNSLILFIFNFFII